MVFTSRAQEEATEQNLTPAVTGSQEFSFGAVARLFGGLMALIESGWSRALLNSRATALCSHADIRSPAHHDVVGRILFGIRTQ
jgi:hypothetical protein